MEEKKEEGVPWQNGVALKEFCTLLGDFIYILETVLPILQNLTLKWEWEALFLESLFYFLYMFVEYVLGRVPNPRQPFCVYTLAIRGWETIVCWPNLSGSLFLYGLKTKNSFYFFFSWWESLKTTLLTNFQYVRQYKL